MKLRQAGLVDPEFARQYYESATRGHWWLAGRVKFIGGLAAKAGLTEGLALDLGAGTISLFPKAFGVVKLDWVVPHAVGGPFVRASVTRLPFERDTFDAVGLFDVLEHMDDASLSLQEARRVLKKGGALFYTVPAFPQLWSKHDDLVGHVRRYRLPEIRDLVEGFGFRTLWSSMYYGFLLAPALLRKVFNRGSSFAMPPQAVNRLLTKTAERSVSLALEPGRRLGLSIGGVAIRL
jgi:SAM-dependent methyltransferase